MLSSEKGFTFNRGRSSVTCDGSRREVAAINGGRWCSIWFSARQLKTGNTMAFSLCNNGSYLLREIRQRKRMSAARDSKEFLQSGVSHYLKILAGFPPVGFPSAMSKRIDAYLCLGQQMILFLGVELNSFKEHRH